MKKTFIKDIREKDRVEDSFLVTRKDAGMSKAGKPYLNLRVMDSTGETDARVWEDAEKLGERFGKDDVVLIKGFAVKYQGGLQINVTDVNRLKEGEYDPKDYLPSSGKDPREMMERLDTVIAGVRDAHIRALLVSIFSDPDIRRRFMSAPAAKTMHHPYLGGLLEHVLSICGLMDRVSDHYGGIMINKDLLLAGAMLHDLGKIYELTYERSFDYTDEGKLLGHITMGVEVVTDKIKGIPGFPRELEVLIKHMLLSHHGHLEFGSPKRPKTLEALILYYLDDLDAKVAAASTLLKGEGEAGWTQYLKIFERPLYRTGWAPSETPEEAPERKEEAENEKTGNKELSLFK